MLAQAPTFKKERKKGLFTAVLKKKKSCKEASQEEGEKEPGIGCGFWLGYLGEGQVRGALF